MREAKSERTSWGVQSLAVFESVARGSYTQYSDLDILVDFAQPVGLFDFIQLKRYLEEITQRRVDLVTPDALRAEMKDRILKEAIYISASS